MGSIRRVFVEKKEKFSVLAADIAHEIRHYLGISAVRRVRLLTRYDIEGVDDNVYEKALNTVLSEPPVDEVYEEDFDYSGARFSVEYLPGQFDQRADSAEQCIRLIKEDADCVIKAASTYVIEGDISDDELDTIKSYCVNPVDSRVADDDKPDTLIDAYPEPGPVEVLEGFTSMEREELNSLYDSLNLAMTIEDFLHIQNYFDSEEHRDPTITEIRVLDTYWSDHCRHTTFLTELTDVSFEDGYYTDVIRGSYNDYLDNFKILYKGRDDKFVCLMDIALLAMKKIKAEGGLDDQEKSDEINACSIVIPVEINGRVDNWLLNFKNETHNHPTEIEPFGGASTCLGGAIRDPLSGRTYVYQAMRITGAADPTVGREETLSGKLPQKKIVREAAHGYSSYGNQIGLSTGYVNEIYHPDYVAKRMEIGAVMAAAPQSAVVRETADPGDKIILLGGRTGRDGIGGATGSSKAHNTESVVECGAEVQKGNPPTERKLQRLFRRREVSKLIKKCNDFGAGGVSVAIGELADGLVIDLDKVTKKYAGLDGTELAISESQERMAVVVAPDDVDEFLRYAAQENLEAVVVADVVEQKRLILKWRGENIVDITRAFLDTNGAHQETRVEVESPDKKEDYFKRITNEKVSKAVDSGNIKEAWKSLMSDLNVCSQKGLVEMFDGSIGASSVLMPHGGKSQRIPAQSMVAKLPTGELTNTTVSIMSYGFDPYLSKWSPYHGAIYAILESVARIVSTGGDYRKIRFTFQEYFRRMSRDPKRWSQPTAALLGAYEAQSKLGLPSIGGKDSMSGSFNDIDVPPTLVSFAVDWGNADDIITPELKNAGNKLVLFKVDRDRFELPNFDNVKFLYRRINQFIRDGKIASAYAVDGYGIAAAISKMAFGNELGVKIYDDALSEKALFAPCIASIVAEVDSGEVDKIVDNSCQLIGEVIKEPSILYKDMIYPLSETIADWEKPLSAVFAVKSEKSDPDKKISINEYHSRDIYICKNKVARPKVFIPVFPGTNCEYDSALCFEKAGAETETIVFKNLTSNDITESVNAFAAAIDSSQIVMFPGGFSAGDEPEGSAKFFATAFRNEKIAAAMSRLLDDRDGLVLGICNGFQALMKLGLVVNGRIGVQTEDSPTLTYNTIGRHISKYAYTKVVSDKSPWLSSCSVGDVFAVPASHGEGRFVANGEWLDKLFKNGQVATMYVDREGSASMDEEYNINGSDMAIEGITSPDGRVFGKMCHSERIGYKVAENIYGAKDMKLFESGVNYFK